LRRWHRFSASAIAAVPPVTNALIADLASARRLGAAMGLFWNEAGLIIVGFLIVSLGCALTFDTLALVTVAVSVGAVLLVRDPTFVTSAAPVDAP
jgi:hypothetical protein